ncbi:MAG TPA: histidine kinase [Abditibacteriaceae bacterium]|jgi:signal transduction histidine kinase
MNKTTDDRMIALMRLMLALSAFLVALLIPLEPARYGQFTSPVLILYVVYSAGFYLLACWRRARNWAWPFPNLPLHIKPYWIDIAWYSVLIVCSGRTNVFFLLYFFAIVVAAFQSGYRPGLRATLGSAVLLFLAEYAAFPAQNNVRFDRFLLEPAALLILGYTISFIGGSELTLRRQLILLKDLNSLSNPRFGIERTLGALAERLRHFYDADKCVMTIANWNQIEPHLRSAVRAQPETAMKTIPVTPPMQHQLLDSLGSQTVWQRSLGLGLKTSPSFYLFDRAQEKFFPHNAASDTNFDSLAATLDVGEFFSVPMCCRAEEVGRLFILNPKTTFSSAEATFLFQAIEHVMPSLDNSLLLDRLASDAAEEERHRIARDLHDSIIQPYIGLKMGINALSKELTREGGDVAASVGRLVEVTDLGIAELYDYVSNLKGSGRAKGSLHSSIERFVTKFTAATTIVVEIEMDAAFPYNDRLAAELFQMICEGLSNIRRHTKATRASIEITSDAKNLELTISNEEVSMFETAFVPRSISGRAASLGGTTLVEYLRAETVVRVTIPL